MLLLIPHPSVVRTAERPAYTLTISLENMGQVTGRVTRHLQLPEPFKPLEAATARIGWFLSCLGQRLSRESRAMNDKNTDRHAEGQATTWRCNATASQTSHDHCRIRQTARPHSPWLRHGKSRSISLAKANQAFMECWGSTQPSRHRLHETSPSGKPQ